MELRAEELTQLQVLFSSNLSPFLRPTVEVWGELLDRFPHLQLFGIPVNNSSDYNSQMLRGLLAILKRLPNTITPVSVFSLLQALQTRWSEKPGFIKASKSALSVPMDPDVMEDPIAAAEYFRFVGCDPSDHLDVCALIGHIAREANKGNAS